MRTILHVDVNSAFLSWEATYRLHFLGETTDIRNTVAAIGGSIEHRHGIILAKSLPAKAYGVRTGESIPEAIGKCPVLKIYPPDYELYEACSRAFMNILRVEILQRFWGGRRPIRHIGVHTSGVSSEQTFRQLSLFDDMKRERYRQADRAVDRIRDRYGVYAVIRASFVNDPRVDPISGGISKEKWGIHQRE